MPDDPFATLFSAESEIAMARWPRHVWTSILTYAIIFVAFPLLCLLAYAWVRQWDIG